MRDRCGQWGYLIEREYPISTPPPNTRELKWQESSGEYLQVFLADDVVSQNGGFRPETYMKGELWFMNAWSSAWRAILM